MTLTKKAVKPMVCALLAALTAAGALQATSIIHVPFDEMVRRSGLIVRATVTGMHVEARPRRGRPAAPRSPKTGVTPLSVAPGSQTATPAPAPIATEGGELLFTHITLLLEELVKGEHGDRVLHLKMPGGTLGDRTVEVVGLPRFEVGKRYYLFLRPDHATVGDFIVGVNQGFFRIECDPSSGAEVLSSADASLIAGVEDNVVVRRAGARGHAAPLSPAALTRMVRSVPGWDERPDEPEDGGRP
jgi:hypothetical protein